jgi:hypothetical protein
MILSAVVVLGEILDKNVSALIPQTMDYLKVTNPLLALTAFYLFSLPGRLNSGLYALDNVVMLVTSSPLPLPTNTYFETF